MFRIAGIALAFAFAAFPVLSHEGVKDPTVKARMDAMMAIGANTKVLGNMAKGKTPFDAAAADKAAKAIAVTSAKVPTLFEIQASDPKSEALPAIWERFDDFAAKSNALTEAALATDPISLDDLRQSLGRIGQACKACHADYRLNKD